MAIQVDIKKKIGNFALDVKFNASDEVLALFGISGSGKSMILNCIAGIINPDSGKIVLNGRTLFDSDKKICLSPQERKVGYQFQNYALFPNMTVFQNIFVSIRNSNFSKKQKESIANEMIKTMNLESVKNTLASKVSGGQKQRTALARIMVNDAEILLLDEPFSSLDEHLKFILRQELHETIQRFGKTVILVSHDRNDVFQFSDQVVFIQNGNIVRVGSPNKLFKSPKTVNEAILIGIQNISVAEIDIFGTMFIPKWGIKIYRDDFKNKKGLSVFAGIKMSDIKIYPEKLCAQGKSYKIENITEQENDCIIKLICNQVSNPEPLFCLMSKREFQNSDHIELGNFVSLSIDVAAVLLLEG